MQGDEALQPGDADEEAETMPGQDPADLPITLGLRLGSDGSQPTQIRSGEGGAGAIRYDPWTSRSSARASWIGCPVGQAARERSNRSAAASPTGITASRSTAM